MRESDKQTLVASPSRAAAPSRPLDPELLHILAVLSLAAGVILTVVGIFNHGFENLGAFLLFLAAGLWIASKVAIQKYKQGPIEEPADAAHEQQIKAERERQIAALKAAAPSSPPEKMRATIQLNSYTMLRRRQESVNFKGTRTSSYIVAKYVDETRFSIDMILQLSETERAIIKQHEVFDIVLDDQPFFSEDELAQLAIDHDAQVKAASGFSKSEMLHSAVKKVVNEQVLDMAKHERRKTRLGDLLVLPFSRDFDTQHEAKQYADKLKTQLLPTMKKIIDSYRDFKPTETVEF